VQRLARASQVDDLTVPIIVENIRYRRQAVQAGSEIVRKCTHGPVTGRSER